MEGFYRQEGEREVISKRVEGVISGKATFSKGKSRGLIMHITPSSSFRGDVECSCDRLFYQYAD